MTKEYYSEVIKLIQNFKLKKFISKLKNKNSEEKIINNIPVYISQLNEILEKLVNLKDMTSKEKLKNIILLQSLFSIKVLNIKSKESILQLDETTSKYYYSSYQNLKKYYLQILHSCIEEENLNPDTNIEMIFEVIQEMILYRYMFYYETGKISTMLDYLDETFNSIFKREKKLNK